MSRKYSLKVLILGDVAVGKSSIANRYVNQTFSYEYKVTIGADFLLKELQMNDNYVTVQIWDTAGQERYQSFSAPFYRGADCALLVYDITDPITFEHIEAWLQNLLMNSEKDKIYTELPVVIVGNRADQAHLREVSYGKAETWCNSKKLKYFETSAKTGENVEEVFDFLVRKAIEQQEEVWNLFFFILISCRNFLKISSDKIGT